MMLPNGWLPWKNATFGSDVLSSHCQRDSDVICCPIPPIHAFDPPRLSVSIFCTPAFPTATSFPVTPATLRELQPLLAREKGMPCAATYSKYAFWDGTR